jgi:hypothetical protein
MSCSTFDGGFCANRLPCGICRITGSYCPVMTNTIEVTCNGLDIHFPGIGSSSITWKKEEEK